MNKLFTKIAGISLGLAMAMGAGFVAATNSKDIVPAKADTIVYTLDGTTTSGSGNYSAKDVTQGNLTTKQALGF